jgi:hypothetical protein
VVVGRFREVKLAEDLTDVRFDGSVRDDEAFGDRGVRTSFGHERQDFEFARAQVVAARLRLRRVPDERPRRFGR